MEKSCFLDESHFEVHGRESQCVRQGFGEHLNTFHILQAPKHPPKKMFWVCCFTLNGTGRLCPSEDMMNSTKYLEFGKNLVPTIQKLFSDGNGIFQQDNAPCHSSKKCKHFFF